MSPAESDTEDKTTPLPIDDTLTPPSTGDTSGYGAMLTLIGAILLALAYYGVTGLQAGRSLGQALPEPFYALAVAFLFVIELLTQRTLSPLSLGRAISLSVVYGGLFAFAAEGGAYIWENPGLVLTDYAGVTVFAVSLVLAVLVYVGYLTIINTD